MLNVSISKIMSSLGAKQLIHLPMCCYKKYHLQVVSKNMSAFLEHNSKLLCKWIQNQSPVFPKTF
jgi:hypothetical protein